MPYPPSGWSNNSGWSNQFYNPYSDYGGGTQWQPGDFANSAVGGLYFDENPEAAWTRYTASRGFDAMTNQGQFARSLFPQVYEGYQAALATNPNLRITDYVQSIDPFSLFDQQSASARGEQPSRFAPRTRTIARGF